MTDSCDKIIELIMHHQNQALLLFSWLFNYLNEQNEVTEATSVAALFQLLPFHENK